jgi:hypothetical protein
VIPGQSIVSDCDAAWREAVHRLRDFDHYGDRLDNASQSDGLTESVAARRSAAPSNQAALARGGVLIQIAIQASSMSSTRTSLDGE